MSEEREPYKTADPLTLADRVRELPPALAAKLAASVQMYEALKPFAAMFDEHRDIQPGERRKMALSRADFEAAWRARAAADKLPEGVA